jgi:hypothetical protein
MLGVANQILSPKFMSGYDSQRKILKELFDQTAGSNYSKENIMLRLATLDSLYSTNASKSYDAIEEIANEIWNLKGNGNPETNANKFFEEIAQGKMPSNGVDVDNWFNRRFGMQKNCKQGHRMTSLLSKYAYYSRLLDSSSNGFPIYDSLVIESIPFVFKFSWPFANRKEIESIVRSLSQDANSTKQVPITLFIQVMSTLCDALGLNKVTSFNMQMYDVLDSYLWRMGKLSNGSLSLLLDKQSYCDMMSKMSLKYSPPDKNPECFQKYHPIHMDFKNVSIILLSIYHRLNRPLILQLFISQFVKS